MYVSAEKAGVEGLVDGSSEDEGLMRGGNWNKDWDLDSVFAFGVSVLRFLVSRSMVS